VELQCPGAPRLPGFVDDVDQLPWTAPTWSASLQQLFDDWETTDSWPNNSHNSNSTNLQSQRRDNSAPFVGLGITGVDFSGTISFRDPQETTTITASSNSDSGVNSLSHSHLVGSSSGSMSFEVDIRASTDSSNPYAGKDKAGPKNRNR
jgi:predicted porin